MRVLLEIRDVPDVLDGTYVAVLEFPVSSWNEKDFEDCASWFRWVLLKNLIEIDVNAAIRRQSA